MLENRKAASASELIRRTKGRGSKNLTEAESKALLQEYGVPVVLEAVALTEADAAAIAQKIGFPVAMKGLGVNIVHKTERGLVQTGIRSRSEISQAFRHIKRSAGNDWEGCLVQQMIPGKRELAAGLFRDPQFGPVVMFGLGGIFAEAVGDVAFRFPPLGRRDAFQMRKELSCRELLSHFRGEKAVNEQQLDEILSGLSRLAIDFPAIREIDINPLIIQPDGNMVAVDALVVINSEDAGSEGVRHADEAELKVIQQAIDVMTRAHSIAVMGARRPGGNFLSNFDLFKVISDFGFPGRLYPVNPNADEIQGHKAYPDLVSLPEKPDHVIICLPARFVPDALRDCVASGSKNVHIFTAGFKETGEAEGLRLQAEIEHIAREGGLNVIGPNCMGLYVPSSGMVTWPKASKRSGPVAFITQSGGHARDFTKYAETRCGIHFSKVISYGNALTLDAADFLKYLSKDDETRIITLYLEGINDGKRIFELTRQTSREKPVILYKAGSTDAGVRVAASHTGALAGSGKLWEAFFAQSGAIRAESLEEMAEYAMTFLHCGDCGGRRVAVLGSGGGISVNAADACAKEDLILSAFPPALVARIREYILSAGTILGNPIDAHGLFFQLELLGQMLKLLSEASIVDMFVISLHLDWLYTDSGRDFPYMLKIADYIADQGLKHAGGKPLVVASRQYMEEPEMQQLIPRLRDILLKSGIPFYTGLPKAVSALSKLAQYHEFKRESQSSA